MKHSKNETRLQNELSVLIAPYAEHWATWTKTQHCFLSEQQVYVMNLLLKCGSLSQAASFAHLSSRQTLRVFKKTKWKLLSYRKHYVRWQNENNIDLTRLPAAKYKKALFLNASFHSRYFPEDLARVLSGLGDTVYELLLDYGEMELLQVRRFGKKKMEVFKKILKANQCENYLALSKMKKK